MPTLSLPTGLQLHYEFWRGGQQVQDLDPAKRTVVFLHAYGTNSSSWSVQMTDPRINQLYNFVTFDAKYHGHSTGPLTPGYTYQHYAEELAMAMDRLDLSECHFIGESFAGCRPAMCLAIARPDLVASMMLISPGFFDGEPDDVVEVMQELSDAYVAGAKRYQSGQVKGRNERAISDEALQGYINYMFGQCLTSEEEVQAEMTSFDDEMGKTRPEYTAEVAHCHMECKRIPGLEKIRQPVLLLRGSRNMAESPESACDLWKEALSNSSRLEFHLCHGAPNRAVKTFPFIVNRFIAGWLAKNSVKK